MRHFVDELADRGTLSKENFSLLLSGSDAETDAHLFARARTVATSVFGNEIYLRGLIEFSNFCRLNCLYCGLRSDNRGVERYRLAKDEILGCCAEGRRLGFRTFVLQSGEDAGIQTETLAGIVRAIREGFPDCAITLSAGEMAPEDFRALFEAGADRYLLRHETISPEHFRRLHPPGVEVASRVASLRVLKEIGFQTGSGIMVGSPFQTVANIVDDLFFLADLRPEMIGIGPFLPCRGTPFESMAPGSLDLTLRLIAVLRLMRPDALIPATTALASLHPEGRERGILAGANVVMPNLSPMNVRAKYRLYDGKAFAGLEAAEMRDELERRLAGIGYAMAAGRGDHRDIPDPRSAGAGTAD